MLRQLAPFLWYGVIFASSSKTVNGEMIDKAIRRRAPGQRGETLSKLWNKAWWVPVKGWHATEFAILYGLLRYSGRSKGEAIALVAVAASLDEYHQTFVKGRTGTPRDVMIDVGGALVAAGVETLLEPEPSLLDRLPLPGR
ncbi:MAG: VanZ family protein [Fimbriimonas sp.]